MMRKLILPIFILSLFAGCSKHYHPLMASKKAKLVSELINQSSKCAPFRIRLGSPSVDDDAIDKIFHEAIQAQCVNEHV